MIKTIIVENENFNCIASFGYEYRHESYKGFPFEPFLLEKVINSDYAYIIDAAGIVWIHDNMAVEKVDDKYFSRTGFHRPSLAWCLEYIKKHDNEADIEKIMNIVFKGYKSHG